jgi:serine protease Do
VGNPFGYTSTLSTGVISAIGRDLDFENGVKMPSLIQTDAPINPGNSGGPLLNIHGQLIGITTAIRAGAQNIGFAIPVDSLAAELTELMDYERLNRVILGAAVAQRQTPSGPAVFVSAVRPGTPAEGKLLKDDRVLAVAGAKIEQIPDFACPMLAAKASQTLRLRVERAGKAMDVDVVLGSKPKPDGKALGEALLGLTLRPVTPELAKEQRLPTDKGLLVVDVDPGSPAERIGLKRKDILFQVDRFYVLSLDDLGTVLEDVKGGLTLRIGIIRGNISAYQRAMLSIQTRAGGATSKPASRPAGPPEVPPGGERA